MSIPLPALIIPDVHNQTEKAESLIAKHSPENGRVVFLGDYFDSADAGPKEAQATARWLSGSLTKPNRTHLFGNHDASYFFEGHPQTTCSGWSPENQQAILEIVEDMAVFRERFQMAVQVGPWLLSHAGFSGKQVRGAPSGALMAWAEATKAALMAGRESPLLDVGFGRGGTVKRGGILWCDFDEEFSALPGIHQIVGHTRSYCVRCRQLIDSGSIAYGEVSGKEAWGNLPNPLKARWRSVNWCIDNSLAACATVTDQELILHFETRDFHFLAPNATDGIEEFPLIESAGLPVHWADTPPAFVPWENVRAFIGDGDNLKMVLEVCGKLSHIKGPTAHDLERSLRRLRQGRHRR